MSTCAWATPRPWPGTILVFNFCYHGTVDESLVTLGGDGAAAREGNVGRPVDPTATTRVVEFNDLDALDRELGQTRTLSAGPGGCTLAWDLEPDLVTVGKAIAGGIPAGAYGLSAEVAGTWP